MGKFLLHFYVFESAMEKRISILMVFFVFLPQMLAAQYTLQWAKTLGGRNWDEAKCVVETSDRGIVLAGHKEGSQQFGLKGYTVMGNKRGDKYCWIVKLNAKGQELWGRSYEDSLHATAQSVIETPQDSGLLVVGMSYPKYDFASDFWIMKTDKNGEMLWQKSYGNEYLNEGAYSVIATSDGNFAITGYKEESHEFGKDFWVAKLAPDGNILWEQTYGADKDDCGYEIVETPDGNFAMVGYTITLEGLKDLWVLKYSNDGTYMWDYRYKYLHEDGVESYWDVGTGITNTSDDALAVCGYTKKSGMVNYDVRVLKIDQFGAKLWDTTCGDVEWEEGTGITETFDKGFAVSGFTKRIGGEYDDFWVMFINRDGYLEWEQTYGGSGFDYANSIIETADKGIVVAGSTYGNERLGWDYAALKLKREGISDYLLPNFNFISPTDTSLTADSAVYMLDFCIQSIDSLQKVEIFVNDSLRFPDIPFNYVSGDTLCNTRIQQPIKLQEGENRVRVRAVNLAGESISETYRLFYVLLLKIRW